MTKLNISGVLASAVTAAALTIAVSGGALAHGGGIGSHTGTNMGGNIGHNTATLGTLNKTVKVAPIGDRDRWRFRFRRFEYVGVAGVPVCFYKWTSLGKVRVCPDLDY